MSRYRRARIVAGELWADGRGWILLSVSVGQLLSLGTRLAVPALLPRIKAEFALTNTAAGLLVGALWASFAVAQLPGGLLSDRFGERDTLAGSMLVAALGVVVVALAPAFPAFVAGLLVFGFGSGLFGTPRLTVLSDVYPDRAATAISVNSAVGNLGNAVFPVVATTVAGAFAWRAGIGVTVPGFLALAAGLWLTVPARTSSNRDTGDATSIHRTARRTLAAVTRRAVLLATASMVCLGFVWQGFTAFLPTYLVEVEGIPEGVAAATLGAFFVGGAVLQPVAGNAADRYDERRVMVLLAAGTAAALAGFPFVDSTWAFVALALAAGLQLAFWPVMFAYVPRALPEDARGSGFGLLRTAFIVLGATGSVAVGALADAGLFGESFLVLAGAAVLALVLAAALPEVPP